MDTDRIINLEPQCLSPRPNWDPHPRARKRVCPPTEPKGGGTHSPVGEGVGGSQFGRVEKKPSTLVYLLYKISFSLSVLAQMVVKLFKFCLLQPNILLSKDCPESRIKVFSSLVIGGISPLSTSK